MCISVSRNAMKWCEWAISEHTCGLEIQPEVVRGMRLFQRLRFDLQYLYLFVKVQFSTLRHGNDVFINPHEHIYMRM